MLIEAREAPEVVARQFAESDLAYRYGYLTEFTFNTRKIKHRFCKTCGVETFALAEGKDGSPRAAVNVNCLDGVDPRALPSKPVDGRKF